MIAKKFLLVAALFAASTSFAADPPAQPAARPKAQAKELSRAEFEALLAQPEKLLIVDVRRPDELTKIGGFPVYLSVQIKELENSTAWIPKDRTIVTVSNHAARSGRAADFLASKGYQVAGTVGAQTFEEQGGKLTKFEVPPPRNAAPAAASAGAATAGAAPAAGGATRQ
jgi:rhodanese-related sulfurtransferase